VVITDALGILCAQLTRDLLAIAKFLYLLPVVYLSLSFIWHSQVAFRRRQLSKDRDADSSDESLNMLMYFELELLETTS